MPNYEIALEYPAQKGPECLDQCGSVIEHNGNEVTGYEVAPSALAVSSLDRLSVSRSPRASARYYDPDGKRFGIPTFPYHCAPRGYATRRQLRAMGLSPGGQDVQAQIMWRRRGGREGVAYLYSLEHTKPKRTPTERQLEAIAKALAARRTCPSCAEVKDYCIPTSLGECWPCHEAAT